MAAMMTEKELKEALETADAAVAFAQQVRRFHRRRKTSAQQRREDIGRARERLKEAMRPLRSEQGRMPYAPASSTYTARYSMLCAASDALQRERRKLTKMANSKKTEEV